MATVNSQTPEEQVDIYQHYSNTILNVLDQLIVASKAIKELIDQDAPVYYIYEAMDGLYDGIAVLASHVGSAITFKPAFVVEPGKNGFTGLNFNAATTFQFDTSGNDLTIIFAVSDIIEIYNSLDGDNDGYHVVTNVTSSTVTCGASTFSTGVDNNAGFRHHQRLV